MLVSHMVKIPRTFSFLSSHGTDLVPGRGFHSVVPTDLFSVTQMTGSAWRAKEGEVGGWAFV